MSVVFSTDNKVLSSDSASSVDMLNTYYRLLAKQFPAANSGDIYSVIKENATTPVGTDTTTGAQAVEIISGKSDVLINKFIAAGYNNNKQVEAGTQQGFTPTSTQQAIVVTTDTRGTIVPDKTSESKELTAVKKETPVSKKNDANSSWIAQQRAAIADTTDSIKEKVSERFDIFANPVKEKYKEVASNETVTSARETAADAYDIGSSNLSDAAKLFRDAKSKYDSLSSSIKIQCASCPLYGSCTIVGDCKNKLSSFASSVTNLLGVEGLDENELLSSFLGGFNQCRYNVVGNSLNLTKILSSSMKKLMSKKQYGYITQYYRAGADFSAAAGDSEILEPEVSDMLISATAANNSDAAYTIVALAKDLKIDLLALAGVTKTTVDNITYVSVEIPKFTKLYRSTLLQNLLEEAELSPDLLDIAKTYV